MDEQPKAEQDNQAVPPPMPPVSPNPVVGSQPILPPQPVIDPQPTTQGVANAVKPKKNLLWLWITLPIVGLLAILVILFLISPVFSRIQAQATANNFMKAMQTNDGATLKELSGESSENSLIKRGIDGLKNAKYSQRGSAESRSDGYVVNFDVTGSDTIVDTSITVSKGKVTKLLLNTTRVRPSSPEPTSTTTSKSSSACLTITDVTNAGVTTMTKEALFPNARIWFQSLFFKADSTEFLSDSLAAKTLDQTSKFYASTSSKNYTFDIQGTAHEGASTSSGVKIANDRASKIKDELTKRGVPAERVNIIEPKSSDNSNDSSGSSDRSITIFIKLPADCK